MTYEQWLQAVVAELAKHGITVTAESIEEKRGDEPWDSHRAGDTPEAYVEHIRSERDPRYAKLMAAVVQLDDESLRRLSEKRPRNKSGRFLVELALRELRLREDSQRGGDE